MTPREYLTADRPFVPDPTLVAAVERLLANREELGPMLRAIADEVPQGRYRRGLVRLVERLESDAPPEAFCSTRSDAEVLLPLLATGGRPVDSGRRLDRLVASALREDQRRRQRRRVFAYPFIVLLLSTAVLFFLALTVVPVFADVFYEFGLELPALTEIVLAFSNLIIDYPLQAVLAVAAASLGVAAAWRGVTSLAITRAVFGGLWNGGSREVSTMAAFVNRLADTVAAQLPLPVAIRTAGQVTPVKHLRQSALRWSHDLEDGRAVAASPSAIEFPATVVQLLRQPGLAGESDAPSDEVSASAGEALGQVADMLANRVDERFDTATGIATQLATVGVGVVVAAVVLAMLLPLVSLISALSG